ncbi:hypothetical protein OIU74_020626, partial [Salix koriyanagi]
MGELKWVPVQFWIL